MLFSPYLCPGSLQLNVSPMADFQALSKHWNVEKYLEFEKSARLSFISDESIQQGLYASMSPRVRFAAAKTQPPFQQSSPDNRLLEGLSATNSSRRSSTKNLEGVSNRSLPKFPTRGD